VKLYVENSEVVKAAPDMVASRNLADEESVLFACHFEDEVIRIAGDVGNLVMALVRGEPWEERRSSSTIKGDKRWDAQGKEQMGKKFDCPNSANILVDAVIQRALP
jgi:hypothetical protein